MNQPINEPVKEPVIRVLIVEPGQDPREATIENTLAAQRKIVGGNIQIFQIIPDDTIEGVSNEDFTGLEINRYVPIEGGYTQGGIIRGTFFVAATVVTARDKFFHSLSDDEVKRVRTLIEIGDAISAFAGLRTLQVSRSCSWCGAMNPDSERFCANCGHEAHQARIDCECATCLLRYGPVRMPDAGELGLLDGELERQENEGNDEGAGC